MWQSLSDNSKLWHSTFEVIIIIIIIAINNYNYLFLTRTQDVTDKTVWQK